MNARQRRKQYRQLAWAGGIAAGLVLLAAIVKQRAAALPSAGGDPRLNPPGGIVRG